MLSEKIKIYVSREVERVIDNDAESFEFYKRDGISLNRNALLTRLIVNFFEEYDEKQKRLSALISAKIKDAGITLSDRKESLPQTVAESIASFTSSLGEGKFDRSVSLKPTRVSSGVIEYVESCCLSSSSLSEYFRNMLSAYANKSPDDRELIIFKEEHEKIKLAISERRRVFITIRGSGESFMAEPYAISGSKEELHRYVLLKAPTPRSVRLSRLDTVRIDKMPTCFNEDDEEIFSKMLKYGPQFIYQSGDGEAVIELTKEGIKKFKKLYVHRPIPDKIEGNLYYFSCSHFQLFQYFSRFGSDAYVISPIKLRLDLLNFYRRAVKFYFSRK